MTAFATADELATFTGLTLDQACAELILGAVSDEIRAGLGWSVTQEPDVAVTLDGPDHRYVFVPTLHLTSVASIIEDDAALTADVDYRWYENGKLLRVFADGCPARWTGKPQALQIVFTHGFAADAVPGVFKTVTLEAAAPIASNPGGALKAKTVGSTSYTYADVRAAAADAGQDSRLDRWRLEGFG